MQGCRSFAEFWPVYLAEHRDPRTRALHYAGTSMVIVTAAAALLSGQWRLFLLLPIFGYGFAWASHAFIERNRPATFTYPLWSLAADFKMWACWVSGRMPRELSRSGLAARGPK
jgi:hypothetical protein